MSLRTRHAALTHVGLKRRLNEDAILAMPEAGVWAVSDGMGGHAGGDFASQTVVEAIAALPPGDAGDRMRGLREAVAGAHAAIRAEAGRRGTDMMGATLVALLLSDHHFAAFWAGDSRIYRLRGGVLEMLTTDHSLVGELVAAGEMGWDEAEDHPQSNVVTRAVGVGDAVDLDKVRGDTEGGDRFLLCSDGLTKYAREDTLRRVLSSVPIERVASDLLEVALAGGAADNVSVIVVDVL